MKFVAFLLVLSLAGAAEAQKPPLPQGDKYTCKPIDTGYAAEVLLPDGAVAPLGVTALSLELDGKVTVGGVGAPNGPVRMAVIMIKGHDTPAAEYKLDLLAGRNS